jgi:hypothetical protein
MRDLFFRIRRYLKYPADTNGKVDETWRRMLVLSENFKIEAAAVQNDLRYLKTLVVALQNQLNAIQEHLRSSAPWFPVDDNLDDDLEFLLLEHLANFFEIPILVNVGPGDAVRLEKLLKAGFQIYVFDPSATETAKLRERFEEKSNLHIFAGVPKEPDSPEMSKLISDDFSALKIDTRESDIELLQVMRGLSPAVIQVRFFGQEPPKPQNADATLPATDLVEEVQKRGYRWSFLLFRLEGELAIRLTTNLNALPRLSWGSLVFFRDYQLFEQAYGWSKSVLPRFHYRA